MGGPPPNVEGAIEVYDIRMRQAGKMIFIDFYLIMPSSTSVAAAHAICDRIEAALRRQLDDAQITIHVEPEHKAKHSGVLVI